MADRKKVNIVASLLDLPEFEPERARVRLPRLGIELELQELSYDKLMRARREPDPAIHIILGMVVNHPEFKQPAWYHDKKGCATPVDALKKLLRKGEVERICRAIDLLNGYAPGSVVPMDRQAAQGAAIAAAVEELEKN